MKDADLVIRGGRLMDPGRSMDIVDTLRLKDGLMAGVGECAATTMFDATDCLVIPGAIDFHAHVYWGGTSLGRRCRRPGASGGDHHLGRHRLGRSRQPRRASGAM